MPSNLISEVVTGPEAKQVAAYSDELKKIKATQKLVAATVALRSPAYKFRAAPSRRWKASDKRRPTWLAAQQPLTMGSVADWIRRRLPEDCRCHTDPVAGRFKILVPPAPRNPSLGRSEVGTWQRCSASSTLGVFGLITIIALRRTITRSGSKSWPRQRQLRKPTKPVSDGWPTLPDSDAQPYQAAQPP